MKLSVMTYRASSGRLNLLRQSSYGSTTMNMYQQSSSNRRGSSLDSWLLATGAGAPSSKSKAVYRKAYSDRLSSPRARRARVVSFDLSDDTEDDDDYDYDDYEDDFDSEDEEDSQGRGGGVMMVDGSPRRVTPPRHNNNNQQQQAPKDSAASTLPAPSESSAGGSSVTPSSSGAPASEPSRASRSRWLKLRTTVQLSGAITQVHKKPPLKREDSFLKRFSTRQIPDPNAGEGAPRRGADGGLLKGSLLANWKSVVNPDENILFYWLSVLTMCLLYNAWTIIARQAFPELQRDYSPGWFVADAFTDLVFVLDIAFQFRTGYLEQGLMVCETRKLAGHYFKSKPFLMDVVAITPLDLVQLRVGILPIIRFPRFLKVYRSFRFYYMVESRTIYPNLWRVVNLIHILLLLAHWFGCFYYMLSELEGFDGEWSYPTPVDDYGTLTRKYLGSVYWSTLTLTTIGDLATPATNLQYAFTIISYLIGVFIFATIVGQVGNVITNRNASRLEFERLLDGAKLYMRHHKVPRNMQRRVQRWYDYSWSRGRMQGGGDINSALGILPDKLKTELALHVNLKTLKKVSIFQECQPEFLHDLVLKMKAYIFTPGDLICRKGEVAREMFIIADGILEVISEAGKVLTQMKAGDFFGEIGILNLDGFNRRTADVRSVGYSELFSLSREDILAAMKDYPEAQEILQTMGRKRLMEARMAATKSAAGQDTNLASGKKGQVEGTRRGPKRGPRTAVSKLKQDVNSLKKLLRSKSTLTRKGSGEENVELKPMPAHPEEEGTPKEGTRPPGRRRKASLKTLMKKMHSKGETDSSSGMRGLATRLASMRLRSTEKDTSSHGGLESSSGSTESSAEATTPLNKALPLLQRIRLLGEQERMAAQGASAPSSSGSESGPKNNGAPTEVIGEGLPLLERLKLLRAKEQAQNANGNKQTSPKDNKSKSAYPVSRDASRKSPLSPRPKNSPFSSLLSSASPSASLPKLPSPKKEAEEKRTQLGMKATRPEFSTELPLLKKVLLMKMMEEKKPAESNSTCRSSPNQNNHSDSNKPAPSSSEDPAQTQNGNSQEVDSDRVYLEQFSRTLGFQMSQLSDDVTPVPQPRPRLNAQSSLSPSPSSENVPEVPADGKEQSSSSTSRDTKKKSEEMTQQASTEGGAEARRKRRLSRMMALREDSDERIKSPEEDEDPFVKSTQCQTEVERSRSTSQEESWSTVKEDSLHRAKLEDGIQEYLLKVMKNVKQAMKAYVLEQQQELQNRILQLEKEGREKDNIIKKLKLKLDPKGVRTRSGTFDDVSSLDGSSLSSAESENGNVFVEPEEEDADDDEELKRLQQRLSVPRKSWPSSVAARRLRLHGSKLSYSMDDEPQVIDMPKPEEMWKIEFPATASADEGSEQTTTTTTPTPSLLIRKSPVQEPPSFETIPERPNEDRSDEDDDEDAVGVGSDWEVRMLVQQFERNSRRRHSSGEALTWDKVLCLRNVAAAAAVPPPPKLSPEPPRHPGRRKYSLIDDRLLLQRREQPPSPAASYTSLTSVPPHRTPPPRPSGRSRRKSSLPSLPSAASIGMSRWLSMDDAKSEGCQSNASSFHTSQETVIGIESRFASLDDVSELPLPLAADPAPRRPPQLSLCTRSPSSPNFASDRELWEGVMTPGWPSSPCLPTITEDPSGRSASLSPTLPPPPAHRNPVNPPPPLHLQQQYRSSSQDCLSLLSRPPRGVPRQMTIPDDTYRSSSQETLSKPPRTNLNLAQRRDFASQIVPPQPKRGDGNFDPLNANLDEDHWSLVQTKDVPDSGIVMTGTSMESQSSVVISIPEYEPLLSP